ncbi:MAG: right-handed parallel beta-helix repeat-containing protein [Rhodanobacteraceae bacterium]|nr:right-handed parallel beta-helix repeat-containing protein [Rhodanobacteraceae bacterium]MBL0041423.1 right-handed parallel beta-helix repeat-containing protein [Xanthomonadales bacterium]
MPPNLTRRPPRAAGEEQTGMARHLCRPDVGTMAERSEAEAMPNSLSCAARLNVLALFVAIGASSAGAVDRIVTNSATGNDTVCDAHCTLEEAIAVAIPGQDVVRFDPTVFSTPQSIASGGFYVIVFNKSLTVIGPGSDLLTINGTLRNIAPTAATSYDIRGLTFNTVNGFWVLNGASARFEDVRFTSPPFSDSAIWALNGNLTVSMCEFVSISYGGAGAAIAQENGGLLNVNNSTFKNNSASLGAGIYSRAQQVSILGNTFDGNHSDNSGGAIYLTSAIKAEVGNNTFYNNTASGPGGAIGVEAGTQTFGAYNNTIVNNQGVSAAIYSDSPTAIIANNIIAMNFDLGNGPLPPIGGGGLNVSHSNITSSSSLNLAPLADNGGLTQTMALLDNSTAISAGDPVVCNLAPINGIDQRGRPRHVCDVGAYASTPVTVFADGFE